jgi:hypothetical protein
MKRTFTAAGMFFRSRDRSVIIAKGYGLEGRDSVPVRAKRLFYSPRCPDRLWGPPSLLSNVYWG